MRSDDEESPPSGSKGAESDYEVGFGRPPAASQFKKGQSGNPKGRPKKVRVPRSALVEFSQQPANLLFMEEAYRPVTGHEGDKIVRMPAIQAMYRSRLVAAIKGNRFAQQSVEDRVIKIETSMRETHTSNFEFMIKQKIDLERELERALACGAPTAHIIPHPDDIIINFAKAEAYLCGPVNREEKADWDAHLARRDAAQAEVTRHALEHRQARSSQKKKCITNMWTSSQLIFDAINDNLPPRYQTQLSNRCWLEGASLPGSQKKLDWPTR